MKRMRGFVAVGSVLAIALAVFVVINTGKTASVSFTSSNVDDALNDPFWIAPGDADLDGDIDFIVGDPGAGALYAFVNTSGTNYTKFTIATGIDPQGLAMGDLDGDDDLDIIASNNSGAQLIVYGNNGGAPDTWDAYARGTGAIAPNAGVIADVDGDGDNDVVGTGGGKVVVLVSNGTLNIASWALGLITSLSGAQRITPADIDNDGDSDFIVTSPTAGSLIVIEDTGSTFSVVTAVSSASNIDPIGFGDVNGDGFGDVVYGFTGGATDTIVWLENDGDAGNAASWTSRTIASTFGDATAIQVVDVDDDGDNDVVGSTREEDQITMYDNTAGDGSVWTERNLGSITNPDYLVAADLDGDGDEDFLLSYGDNVGKSLNTNIVPELVSASITNFDNTNYLYANRKAYNFVVTASDGNGAANIDQMKLRFTVGSTAYALNWDNDGPTCTTSTSPSVGSNERFSISGSCSVTSSGDQIAVTIPVLMDWDMGDATNVDLEAYVADESGATDGWTALQSDYFNIETDVEIDADQWTIDDATLNPSATGSIDYRLDYEGTSLSVPDSQISSVTAWLDQSAGDVDITSTPGTTGSGSVSFTAPSGVGAYTISPDAVLAGDGGTVDGDARNVALTVDRVIVTNIAITGQKYLDEATDTYWDDGDESEDALTVRVTAKSERTSTAVSSGSLTLGDESDADRYGTASLSAAGEAVFVIEEDPASGSVVRRENLQISSAAGNDYGTDVNNNGLNTLSVGWDNDAPDVNFDDTESTVTSGSYTVAPNTEDDTEVSEVLLDKFSQNSGTPTTERASMTGESADGTYYYRARATDAVGNVSEVIGKRVIVDRENTVPASVTAGFDPSDGEVVDDQTPLLSWEASSDPDPSELNSQLIYHVYLDKDAEVEQSYAFSYTTNAGETTVNVSDSLSEGTWYWAVEAEDPRGGVSEQSSVQNFIVVSDDASEVAATLTVGVNTEEGSAINAPSSAPLWRWGAHAVFAAASRRGGSEVVEVLGSRFIIASDNVPVRVLNVVSSPGVNYAVVGLIVLGLGYALGVLRQRKSSEFRHPFETLRTSIRRMWAFLMFFFTRPSHSFELVVPRNDSGTWLYSFSTYQKHQRISRMTAGAGVGLLAVKIVSIVAVSVVLINTAHRVIGSSPYLDDNREVAPDDMLTYRVDFQNFSNETAEGVAFDAPIPDGTTYIAGSAIFNGDPATDASDGDAVSVDSSGQSLDVRVDAIESGAESYFEYRVRITEPTDEEEIANVVAYQTASLPTRATNQTMNPLTPGSIAGTVWDDTDRDGAKDRLEPGLSEVTLRLYKDNASKDVLNIGTDTLIASEESSTNGTYLFDGLGFGTYWVDVDEKDAPDGYSRTSSRDPIPVSILRDQDATGLDFGFGANTSQDENPEDDNPDETPDDTPDDTSDDGDNTADEIGDTPQPSEVAVVDDGTDADARRTITIRDLEIAVPPGEEEILEGFEFLTFGTPQDRRLLESSGGFNITIRDGLLFFEGRAKPGSSVKLTVYSDPYSVTTSVNDDSVWEVQIPTSVIGAGEHRVVAQVTDPQGRTSSDIEIARIVIEREELSQINIIIYGVLVLIIIVLTVLVVHYVYKRHDEDETSPRVPPTFRGFRKP